MSYQMPPWNAQTGQQYPPQFPGNAGIGFEGMGGAGVISNSYSVGYPSSPPPVAPMQNYYPNSYPANYEGGSNSQPMANYGATQPGYPNYYPQDNYNGASHPNNVVPPSQYYVEPETSKNKGLMSKKNKKKMKKYALPAAAAIAGVVIVKKLL